MKKILSLVLVLMLAVAMFAGCSEKKEADNKLVIGYTIYEPMNYMDGDKLTGFDTEYAEAICEKLGYTPEFVEINWDTKFVTLDSKKIDCIWNGMTISEEVKKNCDVSLAYVKNAQVVVMKKDAIEKYADIESLKSLKFTAEAGSAGEAAIQENKLDGSYVPVGTQADAVTAVMGGQADACVIDITMAKAMTADGTDFDSLGYSIELTSEEYGIGFRKGSDLTEKVNKATQELVDDGTLPALAEKYGLNLAF